MKLLLLALLSIFLLPAPAYAQNNQISLSPSIMQLDLSVDPAEYEIIYSNNTDSLIELNFTAEDFTQLEDGWKVDFLSKDKAQNYEYSLASWISFDRQSLTLGPGETQKLKVSIDTQRLSPGGHYGSILARVSSPEEIDGNVKISSILTALLFVRTSSGQEREEARIEEVSFEQSWFNFPSKASLKLQNYGNTHLTPYGRIDIYDPLGKLAGKAIMNEGSLLSLPESIRKFNLEIQPLSAYLLPGNYKVVARVHWGKNRTEIIYETSFFSIGNLLPVFAGVSLISILFLRLYFKRKAS